MPQIPTNPESVRQTRSALAAPTLTERAKRLDAAIAAAGGFGEHWKKTAPRQYRRLVDPVTGEVVAQR